MFVKKQASTAALGGLAVAFGLAISAAEGNVVAADASASPVVVCGEEDGNADGLPCTWTDPETGQTFFVDSTNYR